MFSLNEVITSKEVDSDRVSAEMQPCHATAIDQMTMSPVTLQDKEVALTWQELSFAKNESILRKVKNEIFLSLCARPSILDNLCGSINLGELTALMGPSGAGKSTLLKCITRGQTYRGCTGKIFYHGKSADELRASFITQDEKDHLFMNLTVRESLKYACKLKNSIKVNLDFDEIIGSLLKKLDLVEVKDNIVENCSGGQRKRLAIGLELCGVDKPNFLLLDEPTSGLDSFAGFHVVRLLQRLAKEDNIAIVTTIHQPSFKMLSLFHNIYVLTKAGNCIYNGTPSELADKINEIAPNRVAKYDNPADIIIEIASKASRGFTVAIDASSDKYFDETPVYSDKDICAQMVEKNEENMLRQRCTTITPKIDDGTKTGVKKYGLCKNSARFGWKHLWQLWCRTCMTSIWRQRRFILIRIVLHAVVACVLAGLYNTNIGKEDGCFQLDLDPAFDPKNCSCFASAQSLREESTSSRNVRFQFFSLLFLMFASLMPTVLTFAAEIKVFLNEHRNGWYTTYSYYFSKTIAEIPLQFLFPFCYTYFLYWYSGQIGFEHWYNGIFGFMSWRYAYFLGITILSCYIAQGLGFLIGIMCVNSLNITIIVSSSTLLFLFLFSGFFVKVVTMASSVKWITSLSFIRYSFESLLIILYGHDRCSGPTQPIALYTFHLEDGDLSTNFYWLIGHLICIRLIAFIVLKARADPQFLSSPVRIKGTPNTLTVKDNIPYWRFG